MPPTTVIFTAVRPEAIPIIRRLRLRVLSFSQYADDTTLLQITGMGQSRARQSAQQLLADLRPTRVLITGLCGALDPSLKVADVLHFTKIISPSSQTFVPTLIGLASTPSHMTLLTADHLITTPAEKSRLHRQTAAHAVDMESAAVAAVCDAHHIPWLCLRAVSDTADQALPAYLADMVDRFGRSRPLAALRQLLPHPARLRTLLQIARQSRAAANALANALPAACGFATPDTSPAPNP
ncbi:MAG: phosphorylase family protein [Phycisphaerales bacterium]